VCRELRERRKEIKDREEIRNKDVGSKMREAGDLIFLKEQ
jgi:hypothetical protein